MEAVSYKKRSILMFCVGEKIIYGENGVCTVEKIAPLEMNGSVPDRLFYHLRPLVGSGRLFTPVDSNAYMRPVMSRDEAEAFVAGIPAIEPAICSDNRFNHVDSFYRDLFKTHELEDLVSVIKGLTLRLDEKKTRSSRAEATIKRAKDILYSELSISLDIDLKSVESYIAEKSGPIV